MEKMLSLLKKDLPYDKFPILSVLSNVFLGYAFGKILVTPGEEMGQSLLIQIFLIIGTCLFINYLLLVRKAASGVNRTVRGKLRPFLKEAILCAALNASIFVVSITLFLVKAQSL